MANNLTLNFDKTSFLNFSTNYEAYSGCNKKQHYLFFVIYYFVGNVGKFQAM